MKKTAKYCYIIFNFLIILLLLIYIKKISGSKVEELPKPELSSGERRLLGIDKNINESNIDNYLFRTDSVYRDMRMLKDEANYEPIGGDSNLSGFVKGFEVVPYPFLAPLIDLPDSVGKGYSNRTLYSINEKGEYIANYEESLKILEYLFPKDKNIFLMCGGGGYSGMTKTLLVSLGWDENKIYNTGGYWYYNGKNKVEVYNEERDTYDFWKVPYHNIDFNTLTEN